MIAAIWLGSAVFLMLSASAVFRVSPDATVAADAVGAMLTRWHYIALAAPLVLFALELRHVRRLVLLVLFVAVILAAAQAFVDLQIRAIRAWSMTPVSALGREDPVRKRFGALHGASMSLLLLQAISAAIVVAARQRKMEETRVMSNWNEQQDNIVYKVVMNHEEQYSIWPADRENALGWMDAGFQGNKQECLAYIEQVWTDMRPLSLRKKMEESDSH